MSSSANVLVSASFPSAVSSDWQIRVVLIGCGPLAAVDLVPKVRPAGALSDSKRARSTLLAVRVCSCLLFAAGRPQGSFRRLQHDLRQRKVLLAAVT
jgi:hypothetical protein